MQGTKIRYYTHTYKCTKKIFNIVFKASRNKSVMTRLQSYKYFSNIIPTFSKNSLLNSSVVFGDSIDSMVDEKEPVKYIKKKA